MDEEQQVLSDSRADVKPLHLDVADTYGTQEVIDRFHDLLTKPHAAFTGARPHNRTSDHIQLSTLLTSLASSKSTRGDHGS